MIWIVGCGWRGWFGGLTDVMVRGVVVLAIVGLPTRLHRGTAGRLDGMGCRRSEGVPWGTSDQRGWYCWVQRCW